MTRNAYKTFVALRDLDQIADDIQTRSSRPQQAIRFLKAAEATFRRLASVPNLGTTFLPGELRFAGFR